MYLRAFFVYLRETLVYLGEIFNSLFYTKIHEGFTKFHQGLLRQPLKLFHTTETQVLHPRIGGGLHPPGTTVSGTIGVIAQE